MGTKKFFTAILLIFSTVLAFAQPTGEEAKTFFSDYRSTKLTIDLISHSLPTLAECKTVFKDDYAKSYFEYCENMKEKLSAETQKEDEKFVDTGIETFTTKDVKDGKGNYAGGMSRIINQLNDNITFYKVEQLRTVGADYGMAYKYFVYIKDHWVFFPKPWQAFKEN